MNSDVTLNGTRLKLASNEQGQLYYRDYQYKEGPNKLPVTLNMWNRGGGAYHGDNQQRYGTSKGWDFRRDGEIRLFSAEHSYILSNEDPPTGRNLTFNDWDDPSGPPAGWFEGEDGMAVRTSRDEFTDGSHIIGPWCLKMDNAAEARIGQNIALYEDDTGSQYESPSTMVGRRFMFKAWVNCEAVGRLRLKANATGVWNASGDGVVLYVGEYNTKAGEDEEIMVGGYIIGPVATMAISIERVATSTSTTTFTPTPTPTSTTTGPVTTTNPPPEGDYVLNCTFEVESADAGVPYKLHVSGNDFYCAAGTVIYKWTGSKWREYCVAPSFTAPLEIYSSSGVVYTEEASSPDKADVELMDGDWDIYGRNKYYGIVFRTIENYSTGSITGTVLSLSVTGTNTNWTSKYEGAWLHDTDNDNWYKIASVSTTGNSNIITIEANTGDATADGLKTDVTNKPYEITAVRDGYTDMSIQYYNGSSLVDVPGLSDATNSFTVRPYDNSLSEGLYWVICWDVDSMSSWEAEHTSYTDGAEEGYRIRMTGTTDVEHSISQVWLLEDKDTTGADIKSIIPFDDYDWLFLGYNHAYCKMWPSGLCFPTTRGAGNWGQYAIEHRGIVYSNLTDDAVSRCVDIKDQDFHTPDEVKTGTTKTAINSLALHDNRLFVGKEDNCYYIIVYAEGSQDYYTSNTMGLYGYAVDRLIGTWENFEDSNNFRNIKSLDGTLVLPHSKGMWGLEGSQSNYALVNLSPAKHFRNYSEFHGSVQALAAGRDWHYFIIEPNDGTFKSRIMSFRREGRGYTFHPLGVVNIFDIKDAIVWDDKLWICGQDENTNSRVHYFSLADDDYIDIGSSGITLYYKVDNDSSWTELGTLTEPGKLVFAAGVSGYRINIGICDADSEASPDSANYYCTTGFHDAGYPADKKIFSSVIVTGEDFTTAPIITGIKVNASLDQTDNPQRTFDFKVLLQDDLPHGDTITDGKTAGQLVTNIRATTSSPSVTFVDIHGTSHTCRFINQTPDEQFVDVLTESGGHNRHVENVMHITLEEVV